MASLESVLEKIKELSGAGFSFVVIGDVVLALYTKAKLDHEDLDVYALSPNPVSDEKAYEEFATKAGYELERTWVGTPRLVDVENFAVDFYTNFMEFEVPEDFLKSPRRWAVKGVTFESVTLEQQVLLKARAAMVSEEHFEELASVASELKRLVKRQAVEEGLKKFSDEAVPVMKRILASAGLLE